MLMKTRGWWCADMFLSVVVVAASLARCLEATGSAATRPRRTAGGEAPLASSPREPPLSVPNSRRGSGAPRLLFNTLCFDFFFLFPVERLPFRDLSFDLHFISWL